MLWLVSVALQLFLLVRFNILYYIVDDEVHDGLGHQVSDAFVDDAHVRVNQVAYGLDLTL